MNKYEKLHLEPVSHSLQPEEPAQPLWRTVYVTINALAPMGVVYLCLYGLRSIVAAILVFHALCLVILPVLLVALNPRSGRTIEWYKTHVREQLVPGNWRAQLPFALGIYTSNLHLYLSVCLHTHIFVHICTHTHTHTQRERERERERYIYNRGNGGHHSWWILLHTRAHTHTHIQ